MTVDKAVLVFAGFMVLLSLALTYFVHPAWMLLTIFVGLNMIQSAFTGFCPAAMLFKTLGFKPGTAFN
jgi:Inner membrane protein YgaP-like, transmembrane domain